MDAGGLPAALHAAGSTVPLRPEEQEQTDINLGWKMFTSCRVALVLGLLPLLVVLVLLLVIRVLTFASASASAGAFAPGSVSASACASASGAGSMQP